jgi:hypothetical protein
LAKDAAVRFRVDQQRDQAARGLTQIDPERAWLNGQDLPTGILTERSRDRPQRPREHLVRNPVAVEHRPHALLMRRDRVRAG